MNYAPILDSAGTKLKQSRTGSSMPHLGALWESDIWVPNESQLLNSDAELSRDSRKIHLFPSLIECQSSEHEVMREFGLMVFKRGRKDAEILWREKSTVASPAVVGSFGKKLESGQFKSYLDVVEDFKTCSDRFTAINLANALIANGVTFDSALNVNVVEWGATSEYCAGKRRHPIISVLSPYCSRKMTECFGEAFADLVLNELRSVRESTMASEFRTVLEEIAALAR